MTEIGKPHSEWAEPGIGRKAETAFLTNFQSLGGPLKGPPKQQFWIEFRAILGPGPPLGGLEARNHVFLPVFGPWGGSPKHVFLRVLGPWEPPNHVFLRVFGPWGPETICFYMFLAPGGPKPHVLRVGPNPGSKKPSFFEAMFNFAVKNGAERPQITQAPNICSGDGVLKAS